MPYIHLSHVMSDSGDSKEGPRWAMLLPAFGWSPVYPPFFFLISHWSLFG